MRVFNFFSQHLVGNSQHFPACKQNRETNGYSLHSLLPPLLPSFLTKYCKQTQNIHEAAAVLGASIAQQTPLIISEQLPAIKRNPSLILPVTFPHLLRLLSSHPRRGSKQRSKRHQHANDTQTFNSARFGAWRRKEEEEDNELASSSLFPYDVRNQKGTAAAAHAADTINPIVVWRVEVLSLRSVVPPPPSRRAMVSRIFLGNRVREAKRHTAERRRRARRRGLLQEDQIKSLLLPPSIPTFFSQRNN